MAEEAAVGNSGNVTSDSAGSKPSAPTKKKATKKKATKKKATKKKATKKKATKKKVTKKKVTKKKVTKKKATKKKATKKKAAKKVPVKKSGALVIVESPAKAKTIKKYLGPGYTVKASVGHIKDLPKSKISVDIENGFEPIYEVIRGKRKVMNEIKEAARNVERIYLAPDPDREGEAIAWHIKEELGKRHQDHTYRITFNEITKRAVREAIENPREIDRLRFESQQARRILDRLVGYQISPILWEKVRRGLSAGRVQSVALRLVVEREHEIRAFNPEEYWTIECLVEGQEPPPFIAKVIKRGDDKFRPDNEAEAMEAVNAINGAKLLVESVKRRERKRNPLPPLITSKLQQEGANRLHYTAKRTMMVAQQLYEGVELGGEGSVGLITYMRTDSTRVADEAVTAVRDYIKNEFGDTFVPEKPNTFKSKKSAQEAHEAIRPTSMEHPPSKVKPFLTKEQFRMYRLIWRWFVASQMTPAVYDQTTVDISAGGYTLRATGSIKKFAGFLAAHDIAEEVDADKDDASAEKGAAKDGELPVIEEGTSLTRKEVTPAQHFTQPPPRFSESSLVKELEDKGIGRPSTYAAILSTIVSRSYVSKEDARFTPTELGEMITELLVTSFPKVLDVEFTARMEEALDDVEGGKVDWHALLDEFYNGGFKQALEVAAVEMRDVKREELPTEHTCEKCGEPIIIKWGRNGSFLACQGYPKCRNTRDYKRRDDGSIEILPEKTTDLLCPTCEGQMVYKTGRYGEFLACKAYPDCKGTRPVSIGVDCPEACGGYVAQRKSGRGRIFYGCSSYPDCTFAAWNRPVTGPCPDCESKYLVRKYTKRDGIRISCPVKECLYTRDPELDDEDAKAVAI